MHSTVNPSADFIQSKKHCEKSTLQSTVKYTQQLIFTKNSNNKCIVQNFHCMLYGFRIKHSKKIDFFVYLLSGKHAAYQLSHPSPCLATYLHT
jgi:hypothetical protein